MLRNVLVVLFVLSIAIAIAYLKTEISKIERSETKGSQSVSTVDENGKLIEEYELIEYGPAAPERDSVMEIFISKDGKCARKATDDPLTRPCTPRFHYHKYQNESITVIKGLMGYHMGDQSSVKIAKQGETVTFPYNVPHTFWSLSADKDVILRVRVSPALTSSTFYENYIGIKRDVRNPIIRELNLLYAELESDIYPAGIPLTLSRFIHLALDVLGKLIGMRPYYKEYSSLLPSGFEY